MTILFLRGLTSGIIWKKQTYIIHILIERLKQFDTIIWNGEIFQTDSFTYCLDLITSMYPEKTYICMCEKQIIKNKPNIIEINVKNPSILNIINTLRKTTSQSIIILYIGDSVLFEKEQNEIYEKFSDISIEKYPICTLKG